MPHRCSAFNCRGNYNGEPYTRMVKFPSDEGERKIWISFSAMPNETESLSKLKEVWICAKHFDCEWVTIKVVNAPMVLRQYSMYQNRALNKRYLPQGQRKLQQLRLGY